MAMFVWVRFGEGEMKGERSTQRSFIQVVSAVGLKVFDSNWIKIYNSTANVCSHVDLRGVFRVLQWTARSDAVFAST